MDHHDGTAETHEHHETGTTHEHDEVKAGKPNLDHETTVEIDGDVQQESTESLRIDHHEEQTSGAADVNRDS